MRLTGYTLPAHARFRLRVPQTQSASLPNAQRNAYRRRGAHLRERLFARWNWSLKRSPSSDRIHWDCQRWLPSRVSRGGFCRFCAPHGNNKVIRLYDDADNVIET